MRNIGLNLYQPIFSLVRHPNPLTIRGVIDMLK